MFVLSALPALGEHQLLVFWTQILSLTAAALLLGAVARRFKQPPVVGELAAGLVLGPSILGNVRPEAFEWLFPNDPAQSAALLGVGWLGVAMLLLVTGFETDLQLIRRYGSAAISVAVGALVIPFALGFGLGQILPSSFVGEGTERLTFALFIGVSLAISALPVIAKILGDLNLLRRSVGQLTLAVAMIEDVVGWILLGIIASIAASGEPDVVQVATSVVGLAVVVAAWFTIGQRIVDASLRRVRTRGENLTGAMGITLVAALIGAAITQALHVEAVLGAFIAGIVLGRSRYQHPDVEAHLGTVVRSFLAPLFFATAGLRVDLSTLGEASTLMWGMAMIAVATFGKFSGAYVGATAAGLQRREALALGAGLNARGALEIVVATIGLSIGVLNESAYTVVVLLAIITSVMAPPLLRLIVSDWNGTPEERARLEREAALQRNVVVRSSRILLPSRGGPGSIVAAQVLHLAWPPDAEVTLLTVGDVTGDLTPLHSVLHDRVVEERRIEAGRSLAEAVQAEVHLGFGVIGVGVSDVHRGTSLLGDEVDAIVRMTRVPVVIIRSARNLESRLPSAFARMVVPVSGGRSSRAAQEVGYAISSQLGTQVVLAHAVERAVAMATGARAGGAESRLAVAEDLLTSAEAHGREHGVEASSAVLPTHGTPGAAIVRHAKVVDADLIVIGATARLLEGRPYLGATVEQILTEAEATVVVVVLPE